MKKLTNGNTWDNDLANKIDELIDEHEKLKAEVKAMGDVRILLDLMSDELIRQDEAYDDLRKEFYEALPKKQLTKEKK